MAKRQNRDAEESYEKFLSARLSRRDHTETRALDRLALRERAAEPMVGVLVREGREIYYINTRSRAGHLTGKTREFMDFHAAVTFLTRNSYI